jgi:hypothetical protein
MSEPLISNDDQMWAPRVVELTCGTWNGPVDVDVQSCIVDWPQWSEWDAWRVQPYQSLPITFIQAPEPLRLSDEDVDRIARRVVEFLEQSRK